MGGLILETEDLTCRYRGAARDAVRGVSLDVAAGELVAIVGPNGSGKTSVVRALLGVLPAAGGAARIMGKPVEAWNSRELARVVGVVTQREEPAFPIRVRNAVMFGRYPHMGPVGAAGPNDEAAVDRALECCDVLDIATRWVSTLSGGEWQRVRIARALAQEPLALVLDEPTANLDIRHEMEVFELVAELVGRDGLAGLLVTHHVNLAARFADRIVVMDAGRVRAVGEPRAVITRANLEGVFGWPVDVMPWRGAPQFVPLRRER